MSRFYDLADLFAGAVESSEPGDAFGVTCKFCGVDGLRWEQDSKGWFLVGDDGYQHECDESDLQAAALDEFEDLTKCAS